MSHKDGRIEGLMDEKDTLTKGRGARKTIDMAYVYEQIALGRTVTSIAKELGVSRRTIYRHHERNKEKKDGMDEKK